MKKEHNKLVRDKIPQICRQNGDMPEIRTLDRDEYLSKLDSKLREEVDELLEAHDLAEVADVLEVLRAIVVARGSSMEEVEAIRTAKAEERGTFNKRVYLISTERHDE